MNAYRLQSKFVLTEIIENDKGLFQAQGVLADFDYSKEAPKVIRSKYLARSIKFFSRQITNQALGKAFVGVSLVGVFILGMVLVSAFLYLILSSSEIALLITVWVGLFIISTIFCWAIGTLIVTIVNSWVAGKFMNQQDRLKNMF